MLYPLWEAWKVNFSAAYPSVTLNVAAGGSGLGQQGVEDGTLQLGASDAYATAAQLSVYPCILNIPVAISAQQIMYNLPGLSPRVHLNFSGPVLAGIYNGSITAWSSPQITSLQTNASVVSYLNSVPSTDTIIPIVRSDSSGDSFIFTEYLSVTTPSWNSTTHYSTLPSWPTNPAEKTAMGNSGMVSTCNTTSYSLAYIGVSYLNKATVDNPTPLGYAYLKNQAGNYVNISTTNINAAVTAMASSTPQNEIQSLIFAPGSDSYPIVNFEYIWVANYQTTPGTAAALRTLLTWCIIPTEGNAAFYLGPVNFVPLPTTVEELSLNQIAQISGP